MRFDWEKLRTLMGAEWSPVSRREKAVSAMGGFIGMLAVMAVSRSMLGEAGAVWVVASMGASAVLLFAIPHGQLSQPWPLLGGHLVSALIGVTCAQWVASPMLGGALAVGAAIGAMYYLRCLHPPGGATALTAVLGGAQVQALGYGFVLTPVLVNVLVLLATAVVLNRLFTWRVYPLALAPRPIGEAQAGSPVAHGDLVWALRQIDSYVDVPERELARIVELAETHAHGQQARPEEIAPGGYYSNGSFGDTWQVRKVVHHCGERESDCVRYRIAAGAGRGGTGRCSREEFARWARYRVVRHESTWQRLEGGALTVQAENVGG